MENTKIITLAYELAKTKYKSKAFTFEQLWADLVKKAKLDKEEQQTVGNVYTTMLQDHRFIFIGDRQWKIREFLKEDEQESLTHALYDFKTEEAEEHKRLAELRLKEKESNAETFKDEEELENEHKENKEKLMHDDSDEDESDKNDNNDEIEDEEESEE